MNNPQKRTWTMKHPALAKAYAVVTVVMCCILIFGAAKGYTERAEENEDRLRYEQKFSERITNYIELSAELENSISYEEAWAELEKIIEKHEDDASQHRTDLAMYSAEKGGNIMGAELLYDAMNQVKGIKQEFEDAKNGFEELKAGLQQLQDTYDSNVIPLLEVAQDAAAGCAYYKNNEALRKVMDIAASEPVIPTEVPTAPVFPLEPLSPEALKERGPAAPDENAGEEEIAAYEQALAEHNAYVAAYEANYPAVYAQYQEDLAKAESEYEQRLEEFTLIYWASKEEHGIWEQQLAAAVENVDFENLNNVAAEFQAAYDQIAEPSMMIVEQMGAAISEISGAMEQMGEALGSSGASGGIGSGQLPLVAMENLDPATASYDQIRDNAYNAASDYVAIFSKLEAGFSTIVNEFNSLSTQLSGLEVAVKQAEGTLAKYEEELKKGEKLVQTQLENVWYNLGELEKDRDVLEGEKVVLDDEAKMLSKEIKKAEDLRELENDHVSAKLLLTSVKEVNDMFAENDDLVASAEKYLEDYKAETESLYNGRLIVCVLAAIGGIAGLAGIPAVYDFARRRFWLIWPIVICVIAAAAAEAVYFNSVHEMWYVGLFVAIIAALHLLIVIPKEKIPVITET